MVSHHRSLRVPLRLAFAAVVALCSVAADAPDSPDAVIVAEATAPLLCTLSPALARLENPAILVHSPRNEPYIEEYLAQIGARRVWVIDSSHRTPANWHDKFQAQAIPADSDSLDLARRCWDAPESIVLVDGRDSTWTIAASLLATALGQPAVCIQGTLDDKTRDWIGSLGKLDVVCVGPIEVRPADAPDARLIRLSSLDEALAAYQAALGERPIDHLVVLGREPGVAAGKSSPVDWLVAQYAVRHRAAVAVLDRSTSIERQIEQLIESRMPAVRYVTLWGDTRSVPDEQFDDPVAAAGLETKLNEAKVAVAPLSGVARQAPCLFRVGRITGDGVSSVSLLVARNLRPPQRTDGSTPTALVLANTDSDLPIMETITRTTVQTLEATGWNVRANYGWRSSWYKRFGKLWGADLVIYEGHTANLANSVQFDPEREPIFPGLYVFQGCKTLRQPEVTALLRNGAASVVGTSTNTYSASGSALAKVVVDAMAIDHMDAGTSLMVGRNFMLALSELKQRRGHEQGPKILRGGMTFALWGDPTWHLPPSPTHPADSTIVRSVVRGRQIELQIPDTFASPVQVSDYSAEVPTGAKLAGMYEWETEERERRQLPPLYFAVIPLPDWTAERDPRVTSPLAKNRWVSLWDARNRWLYLLVQSSGRNEHDRGRKLSFRLESAD
jgi:hypothetical protein